MNKTSYAGPGTLVGAGFGGLLGGGYGFAFPFIHAKRGEPTFANRATSAVMGGAAGGAAGGGLGFGAGFTADVLREAEAATPVIRSIRSSRQVSASLGRAQAKKRAGEFRKKMDDWTKRMRAQAERVRHANEEARRVNEQARRTQEEARRARERARQNNSWNSWNSHWSGGSSGAGTGSSPSFSTHAPKPSWVPSRVKTKAEAKKAYHREAIKHHPDVGGHEEQMKRVNAEWDRWRKTPEFEKLSTLLMAGFRREISLRKR